jgi:hypothetical protein
MQGKHLVDESWSCRLCLHRRTSAGSHRNRTVQSNGHTSRTLHRISQGEAMIQVKDGLYEAKDAQGITHVGRRFISNGQVFIVKFKGTKTITIQVQPHTVKEIKL